MSNWYSTNGVDSLLAPHLPEFGYAVDVGANNGLFSSNSKALEDKGWIVLCVEPNPLLLEEGKRNRKLWRQVACGSKDSPAVSFTVLGQYPYASFSGMHFKEAPVELLPPEFKDGTVQSNRIRVEMKTLNTLLIQAGFPRLDFLTVDVEGHELEVLKGIDLNIWTPKIIVAEAWDEKSRKQNREYLAPFGYVLDVIREYDCCYGRR